MITEHTHGNSDRIEDGYTGVDIAGGRDISEDLVDAIQLQAKNAADRLSRDDEQLRIMCENCGGCGQIILSTLLHAEEIRLLRMIADGELVPGSTADTAAGAH